MTMLRRRPFRFAALALAAGLAVPLAAGCAFHRTAGNMRSDDHFTYISTWDVPVTVELVDLRDGAVLWTYDLPIDRKLSVRFYRDASDREDPVSPDLMRWGEFDRDDFTGALTNAIPVPPSSARRIQWHVRETAEIPPELGVELPG